MCYQNVYEINVFTKTLWLLQYSDSANIATYNTKYAFTHCLISMYQMFSREGGGEAAKPPYHKIIIVWDRYPMADVGGGDVWVGDLQGRGDV